MFQHTAARRRLGILNHQCYLKSCFNTQPPEGGWRREQENWGYIYQFQHTAARRRLDSAAPLMLLFRAFQHTAARRRLVYKSLKDDKAIRFNTQPPEGGWSSMRRMAGFAIVSTHSRPKAAGK